ncbi:adiponectin receptor protein 1 [Podospora conica]|nr:adiponectin receptor protein 1 [Schizothecium conicum]
MPGRPEQIAMNKKAQKDGLLTWAEILPWQRDNEFIMTGYRRASFSYAASLKTLFGIHNETANIWSHLLGALLFIALSAHFFVWSRLPHGLLFADGLAVGVYLLGVIVCFLLSTVYHTFSDHSPHMHKFGNELDHLGIVLVIWGTGVSGAHFGFYHEHATRNAYFALLTAVAIGCGVFTLRPKFRRPSYRFIRSLMYAFLGASLFIPIGHGLSEWGWDELDSRMGLGSFFGLAVINFSGSALYASRIPERWFPGQFDILGQSHNWMHVLVLTGALVRLNGLVLVARRWQEQR